MLFWRVGLAIAKFCLRWLVLPGVAGLLYYWGYVGAAKWVLVGYGIYIAFHIVLFPWRYMNRRRLKKQYADLEGKLKQLIQIYQSVDASTLNPTRHHNPNEFVNARQQAGWTSKSFAFSGSLSLVITLHKVTTICQ